MLYIVSAMSVQQRTGVDAGKVGGHDPLKICRKGQSMFWPPPENVAFFPSKLLLYNCKFHSIKDEQLDTYHFTDIAYADDATNLMSDQLQADSVLQSTPLLVYWTLSYHGPRKNSKTWVQVPRRLIDHASYALIDRLQLRWLTMGIDPGGWEVPTP